VTEDKWGTAQVFYLLEVSREKRCIVEINIVLLACQIQLIDVHKQKLCL